MLFILFIFLPNIVYMSKPNVCNNFVDYLTMDPKNCWYNPDLFLDAIDLIRSHGYPYEEHEVETEDGYLLTMYRIPRYDSKHVIYLQHPATATCTVWIDKANDSLAFILWDQGFDIWLGNFRGNYYSRKHKIINPNDKLFWEFSFHELGCYDISNQIDFIVNQTNVQPKNLSLIGYSMSSTAALIYASEKPKHASKWLNVMILMAPSSYMENTNNVLKELSKSSNGIKHIADFFGIYEFNQRNNFTINLLSFCRSSIFILVCMISELIAMGNMPAELSAKWYPVMHAQTPGGMSMKPYHHYVQIINSKNKFRQFDYGKEENIRKYNSVEPPEYNVSQIEVPTYLMYAENDPIVNPVDVEHLYKQLPEKARIYGKKKIKYFAHQSFIYGVHAVDWVYKPIVRFLNYIFAK